MKPFPDNRNFRDYVFLFLITVIAFWPISLNYLSLKNDALVQYLVYRYHISEAIRHGYLPFWDAYWYTGFPVHSDMQGSVWNPFVLILSMFGTYDMTLLQWELLIYLFLAAFGMYRLVRYLGLSRMTAICGGSAFVCCGYMTDSISVLPWIPSAAFSVFVLLYFIRLLRSSLLSDGIKLALALSLLFVCGYPSFFIYLNYLLAIGFMVWGIHEWRTDQKRNLWRNAWLLFLAYLLFLVICSPAIVSYYQFLPYYSRGSGLSYQLAASNPQVIFSYSTYLLANVASKAVLPTDVSMRNAYIGLFVFLFFLNGLRRLDGWRKLVLALTLLSMLFSLGSLLPVQAFFFRFLPLMNTFRHAGTMRIFSSIGMILLAAYPMDAFFRGQNKEGLKRLAYLTLILLALCAVYFLVTQPGATGATNWNFTPAGLRQLLYGLSFQRFAFFICLLQIGFVLVFLGLYRRNPFPAKALLLLLLANSIVFAWIGLPFTAVSQYRTREVNAYLHSFPKGYPKPDLNSSVQSDVYSDSAALSPYGYDNFYNKRITIQDHVITPTLNTDYDRFLGDKRLRSALKGYPFAYLLDSTGLRIPALIRVQRSTPGRFLFEVEAAEPGTFHLFQQYNANWRVTVNRQQVDVQKSTTAFMSVPVPGGRSLVDWSYRPVSVYLAMILSALCLLALAAYFVVTRNRQPHL